MGRGPWLVHVLTDTGIGLRSEIKDSCCQGELRPLGGVQDWLGRTSAVQVLRGGIKLRQWQAGWKPSPVSAYSHSRCSRRHVP